MGVFQQLKVFLSFFFKFYEKKMFFLRFPKLSYVIIIYNHSNKHTSLKWFTAICVCLLENLKKHIIKKVLEITHRE